LLLALGALVDTVCAADGTLGAHADNATVAAPERTSRSASLRLSIVVFRSFDIDTVPH
jgi:hypothetical protein